MSEMLWGADGKLELKIVSVHILPDISAGSLYIFPTAHYFKSSIFKTSLTSVVASIV